MLTLLHITDCHLFDDPQAEKHGVQPSETFFRVLEKGLSHTQVDHIVLGGDLVNEPTDRAYERIADALSETGIPWSWVPGNHDRRKEDFPKCFPPFKPEVVLNDGWLLMHLDTQDAHNVFGKVTDDQLERLAAPLPRNSQYRLAVMHHPAHDIGNPWMDAIGLVKGKEKTYAALSATCRGVLAGHVHHAHQHFSKEGCAFITTPSSAYQYGPEEDRSKQVTDEPPGARLLYLEPDGTLNTELVWCDSQT